MSGYIESVSCLPRPSSDQCRRFADFVAGAHSWYKHLPSLPPGAPFCFYLNPNAGRTRVRTRSGEVGFVDRIEGDGTEFHYTWMPTEVYRDEYGYWDYYCPRSPIFHLLTTDATHEYESNPLVLTERGDWVSLPEDLRIAGTCTLTALVHLNQDPRAHVGRFPRYREAFEAHAREHPTDPEVCRYRKLSNVLAKAACCADAEVFHELDSEFTAIYECERPILLARMRRTMERFLTRLGP